MGRTIPWLKEQSSKVKGQSSHARSSKRQKVFDGFREPAPLPAVSTPRPRTMARVGKLHSDSHFLRDINKVPRSHTLYISTTATANGRVSASYSISCLKLKTNRFMREGLEQDDIYIMVEDEFYAVAKTFTQYLHHAEYVRLKNIAKNRNIRDTISVARSIDSITLMREDTKRRREQEAKATRQRAGLDMIRAHATSKRPETVCDDESEDEARAYDDPWIGTTLQGLMASPSRNQMSLTGLQRVKSCTRAAAGYSKPRDLLENAKTFDLVPKKRMTRSLQAAEDATPDHDMRNSDSEDDLDGSVVRREMSISSNKLSSQKAKQQEQRRNSSAQEGTRRKAIRNHSSSPTKRLLNLKWPDPMDHYPTEHGRKLQSGQVRDNVLPSFNLQDEGWPKPTPLKSVASKRLIQRGANAARGSNERSKAKNNTSKIYEIPFW